MGSRAIGRPARWVGTSVLCALITGPATASAAFLPAESADAPSSIESAYSGPEKLSVHWSPPSTPGWTGFLLFRDGGLRATLSADARSFVDGAVWPATTTRYRVEARYPDGHTGVSHAVVEKMAPLLRSTARYDVVVVRASSAGVAAAVTAAREGLRVAVLEPTDRLGGIMSSGLSSTDIRAPEHCTGFFKEFRRRIQAYYGNGDGLRYEPHVVNNVLKAMVAEQPGIDIYYHVRPIGVMRRSARVTGVTVESLDTGGRSTFFAPITIDADPTGDVMAWSGCEYRVGREARSQAEPHAGVIYYWRAKDVLLPGSDGRGDSRLMAYAYLLVVKDYGAGSSHLITKPEGYRESNYIHSPEWKDSWAYSSGAMPRGKYELNQHPQGNDLQDVNYGWPSANTRGRIRLEKLFRNHALGYLYYLQTRDGLSNLGLPDDEFPENAGFPEEIYVREARRVVGIVTLKESDVVQAAELLRPDGAGIGDYPMDSHAVRPKTDWTTPDMGEGEFWLYRITPWFQIPVGIVIPRDRDGLLVAEAVSATHVAYGTLRTEPVRMEMGEMCGMMAAISLQTGLDPRGIPPSMLQDRLGPAGQSAYFHSDVPADAPYSSAIQFMSAHGFWQEPEFHPDAVVTRGEAAAWLRALQWMEAAQSGAPEMLARQRKIRWPAPSEPGRPLDRGTLAQWLVRTESDLKASWSPTPSSQTAAYPDIDPSSPMGMAAAEMYLHRIDSAIWHGTSMRPDGKPEFGASLPVTRADLAETFFLAQRDFASPLYEQVFAIADFGPTPIRKP